MLAVSPFMQNPSCLLACSWLLLDFSPSVSCLRFLENIYPSTSLALLHFTSSTSCLLCLYVPSGFVALHLFKARINRCYLPRRQSTSHANLENRFDFCIDLILYNSFSSGRQLVQLVHMCSLFTHFCQNLYLCFQAVTSRFLHAVCAFQKLFFLKITVLIVSNERQYEYQ